MPGALAEFRPQQLAALAQAFAAAGMRHDSLLDAVAAATLASLGRCHGWVLVEMGVAFQILGYSSLRIQEAAAGAAAAANSQSETRQAAALS